MSDAQSTTSIEYRDIPGRLGYRAASDGRVQSRWTRNRPSRLGDEWHDLKPILTAKGYHVVCLRGGKTYPVHQLILEAFVGPRPPGHEACHGDGNPANNRLDNLRWGTHQENEDDKRAHGTRPRGSRSGLAKITEVDAVEIRRKFAAGGVSKIALAREYGLHHSTVIDIISGKLWRHV